MAAKDGKGSYTSVNNAKVEHYKFITMFNWAEKLIINHQLFACLH